MHICPHKRKSLFIFLALHGNVGDFVTDKLRFVELHSTMIYPLAADMIYLRYDE